MDNSELITMFIFRKIKEQLHFIFSTPVNFFYCLIWGFCLVGYWRGINNHIPLLGNVTDEMEIAFVVIPLIASLGHIVRRMDVKDWITLFLFYFVYFINYILFPENEEYLTERLYSCIVLTIPYFIIGTTLDIEKFLETFFYISVVSILMCAFYELSYLQSASYVGDIDVEEYNMTASYSMLQHVILVSWFALKDMKLWRLIVMVIGLLLLFAFGTRGPLVCIILFIVIYLLFLRPSKYTKIFKVIVIAMSVLAFYSLDAVMIFLQIVILNMGMSTRIFDKYFTEELGVVDSRDAIIEKLMNVMQSDNQILGHGLLGSYKYVGTYPHRIWVEFVFSFGWILGCILLALLAILIIKAFCKSKSNDDKTFLILLVCGSIVKLFFSSTFLDDTLFFLLIGCCYRLLKYNTKVVSI